MVPKAEWFLHSFVRKEALITSQIESTQATLRDVLAIEAGEKAERPDDVREVCNYAFAIHRVKRNYRIHLRLVPGPRGGGTGGSGGARYGERPCPV